MSYRARSNSHELELNFDTELILNFDTELLKATEDVVIKS